MFNEKDLAQRAKSSPFGVEGFKPMVKELVETERIFESVDDNIAWTQTLANIKLRDRLVWFCIASFAVEMFFLFLHSASVIELPGTVLLAVSALMGGSGFGLGSLLFYIARDLFRNR
jgi:hypothetical protein